MNILVTTLFLPRQQAVPANRVPSNFIVGDGNCGFRALAHYLEGNQDQHAVVRNIAVETMRQNPWFLTGIPHEVNRDNYLNNMALTDVNAQHRERWMTDSEILAIAYAYSRQIVLVVQDEDVRIYTRANMEQDFPQPNSIFIYYVPGHYEVFVDQPRPVEPARPVELARPVEPVEPARPAEPARSRRRVPTATPMEQVIEAHPVPENARCYVCGDEVNSELPLSYCGFGVHGSGSTNCSRILCSFHYTSKCEKHDHEKKGKPCSKCSKILF